MPIKNLTDREQDDTLHLGYPRIARLYKGDPKVDPKRPGKDRDTFRVEFEPAYNTPEIRAVWDRIYGAAPTAIGWAFLFGYTTQQVFPTWMEEWTKTVMLHRCDGETQVRHYDKATGKYSDQRIPCACTGKDKPTCQRVGRLNLWLPLLMREIGVKGYVSIATHSVNDLITVSAAVNALFREYGDISAIPLVLGREAHAISTPMNGERATTTKSLLYLRIQPEYVMQEIAGQGGSLALPTAPKHAALPAPKAATAEPEPAAPDEPVPPVTIWTPETVERAKVWIVRNFGIDPEKLLSSFGDSFATFEDVTAWQNAVKAHLRANETPIIARALEVGEGYTDLVTTLGKLRASGGASAFERLFGDEREQVLDHLDPADWKAGVTAPLAAPIWVTWKTTPEGDRVTALSFSEPGLPAANEADVTEGEFEEVNDHA